MEDSSKDLTKSTSSLLGSFYDVSRSDGKPQAVQTEKGEPAVEQPVQHVLSDQESISTHTLPSSRLPEEKPQEEQVRIKVPSQHSSPREHHPAPQEAVFKSSESSRPVFQEKVTSKQDSSPNSSQPSATQKSASVTPQERSCSWVKPVFWAALAGGALYTVHKPSRQKVNDLVFKMSKKVKESKRARILAVTSLLTAAGVVFWYCTCKDSVSSV